MSNPNVKLPTKKPPRKIEVTYIPSEEYCIPVEFIDLLRDDLLKPVESDDGANCPIDSTNDNSYNRKGDDYYVK